MLQGQQLFFSGFPYTTTVFIGMAILNATSLQMFEDKMKIFSKELQLFWQNNYNIF